MTPEKIATALRSLIEDERAALISGQIDKLDALGQRKLELLEKARRAGVSGDAAGWPEIRDQNARNGALIAAAQRGLKEARARLQHIRDGGMTLKTYDRQGRSIKHPQTPKLMTKRA